ncbi:PaaI family thioesterase [Rhodobacter sp. NTK016B]|uniref:PaaI family thioesterase n=1 Tax=Rhodobacter sp. NTK016B TaxID=2759676 RepID=UPI001A8C5232|nr:PaaI family thioesterase [Rhodobacter sp. NTK016B]MBN8290837.1 PaaI family thioesterase [Rhodobacter sp. NTK016B]
MPDTTKTVTKNADATTGDEPESFFAQGGFLQGLGLRRSLFEEDRARFELAVEPRHMNRLGIPHGGVYATMLDSALGAAGCWDGAPDRFRPSVTLNLNVSYLAQPKGSRLIADGRRTGGGKSIYFSEGEIRDDTGVLIATATGTFKVVRPRS